MAQGWSHGPVGAVVAAWPAVSLVGSYELLVWLIRTSGAVERGPSAEHLCNGAACRATVRPLPTSAVDGERPGGSQRDMSDPARGPRVRPPGSRPSPQAGSVMMRCLRPAPSMTRRWPPTGSACRPAIRCRNAGSPRCSDAHPAAGRERESPMHDKHHRSKTRRAPRSRLNRRPLLHPGERTWSQDPPFFRSSVIPRVITRQSSNSSAHLHPRWLAAFFVPLTGITSVPEYAV